MRKKNPISVSKKTPAKRKPKTPPAPAPQNHEPIWITFEELERYTGLGLTDRRYRQIAKEGFFPDPQNGQYDLWLTIRGLLKYFRESQAKLSARKQAIADEQHRKLKRENDIQDQLVVKRAQFVSEFRQCVQPMKDILRQKLTSEYPTAVAGMDVPQARIFGQRLEADILTQLQALFDKWKL